MAYNDSINKVELYDDETFYQNFENDFEFMGCKNKDDILKK